nr:ubiquitin carboxyl-terminal hydrolase Usp2 isoform X2 [Drosophila virilis]XP_032294926.1 ubiquitin carboxyl-terminal hydrolase Usp2 isoform X2 [Drosophila virilis]XP_032294928.1 ubiquitin carboxyl-terminal hydrolase Usp2 isoform X2 [Drosophila virilis]XP_032294935.1 ubiquitin carboxyl-terminal hydrolase Usp2 isoform X2 [Drosophila virilis]
MRVISPRRSSTSAAGSGSLYGTTSTSGAGSSTSTGSSSSSSGSSTTTSGIGIGGGGGTSNGYSRYSSSYYDNRGSSLSKLLPSSAGTGSSTAGTSSTSAYNHHSSSASSYYPSSYSAYSYTPRINTQRNSIGSASYLSGGSGSALNSGYRNSASYLSGSNYDSVSYGRCGLPRRGKGTTSNGDVSTTSSTGTTTTTTSTGTATKKDDWGLKQRRDAAKKLPPSGADGNGNDATANGSSSKRLSSSCSSSSLAHFVATSALDIYEKYSPANYKPNCELSRSRSAVNEADTDNRNNNSNSNNSNDNSATCTVTLDRPRSSSRYSRLYSSNSDAGGADTSASETSHLRQRSGSGRYTISGSNSSGDVPTATFTLRSNRTRRNAAQDVAAKSITNGHAAALEANSNGLDAKLNGLSLLSTSPKRNAIYESSSVTAADTTDDATATVNSLTVTAGKGKANGDVNGAADGDVDADGDVSATATLTLAEGAAARSKVSRNSGGTVRSVLPPVSPTSSRYWDRDSGRNNTNATSSSIGTSSLSNKHNNLDDGYKSTRDEKFEGLCGLRNIGNTCFMNSVIQCLSHTTELTRFLRAHHTSTRTATSKDQQILHEFAKLIQEMWTTNVHSVTPMELKRAFSTKHRMYSDYNQQDAQEFLRFFLDSLHSALNTGVKGETLNIDDNLSDNKKADLTWEWYARHENSLIRDLFVGQLKSTLKCTTCGNTSVTFDPFWDLSVPLPSSSRCKLEACLDLFIREEVLDGDEMPTCSKCKTRRKCTKSFTIQRFPKYLVIHLKRFSETRWSKLSNIVEFPTADRELNMASYGANANSNVHYSLYAISNHMGSTAGGHYVALCKHPVSHKWHEFNDNSVSDAIPENCLVSSSAYILFYERA